MGTARSPNRQSGASRALAAKRGFGRSVVLQRAAHQVTVGQWDCPLAHRILHNSKHFEDVLMNHTPELDRKISPDVKLGKDVRIFAFTNLYGCEIGDESKIGTFVEIQRGAKVGRRCKISSHTFICEGVTIEDEVFIGHGVMFTNDLFPRATNADGSLQTGADWKCLPTVVKKGAAIGSNATLLCGISIGERAVVGAGSVVTKDVPPDTVVAGNPARALKSKR
jgi:acetyltransferase-like isoleucine patch superfamily enzyme